MDCADNTISVVAVGGLRVSGREVVDVLAHGRHVCLGVGEWRHYFAVGDGGFLSAVVGGDFRVGDLAFGGFVVVMRPKGSRCWSRGSVLL
jgi:hypothetical protein